VDRREHRPSSPPTAAPDRAALTTPDHGRASGPAPLTRGGEDDAVPTRDELEAARDRLLPDVLPGPGDPPLRVLFCGINPGLLSAFTGHHFARPGNRFWPALHASGFTPRRLAPVEQHLLPGLGLGITNVAPRATARADELGRDELVAGGETLRALTRRHAPAWLAVVGIGAYRVAFDAPRAQAGRQDATVGPTRIWVLPNPSGLNAHHTPQSLAGAFAELREAAEETS
jgi:double-stranded uracil-DNA glycosylase